MSAISQTHPARRRARPLEEPETGNYFVAVYPPVEAWEPKGAAEFERALDHPASGEPLGIYAHLPFCRKKCDYCYYLSFTEQKPAAVNNYLKSLVGEMGRYAQRPSIQGRPVKFVHFGGGTPSTLSSGQARFLADGLRAALPWKGVEEVTFECAPQSVRAEFLETLQDLGVTRLSMGVQSFDDQVLKLNGRNHLRADILRAYGLIQETGFDHVNLDLMVGMLGETAQKWRETVECAIEAGPDSVTIYQTEIRHNTQTYRDFQAGTLPALPASWETKRARLCYAFGELERAGYTIISGDTAVKDPAKHRFVFQDHLWHGGDVLGLGAGSNGCLNGFDYQNETTLEDYQGRCARGELPVKRALRLGARSQLVREFVLQLKWGSVSPEYFQSKFGEDVVEVLGRPLERLARLGLLVFSKEKIELTRAGLYRADRLLREFYEPSYRRAA